MFNKTIKMTRLKKYSRYRDREIPSSSDGPTAGPRPSFTW